MAEIGGIWQAPTILSLVLIVCVAMATFSLILALMPLLRRYALARPNARSSHRQPTPQGAGIAVVVITVITCAILAVMFPDLVTVSLVPILVAAFGLAVVGAIDDIHTLEALPRLAIQSIAVVIVIVSLPAQLHIFSPIPIWLERTLLSVALLWFVNLVNFMDGIDWMTVAETVPLTAALALFGLMGSLPAGATLVALALCGAMLGFAPLNRPIARVFLGDVGSLPVGLLLGWMLVLLAEHHLAAALLLPLYYVADATITLLSRLMKGERVMQAHRSHFYQRALVGGLSVYQIVGRVFLVNIALAGLGFLTLLNGSISVQAISLIAGGAIVTALLWNFENAKTKALSQH